MAQVLTFENLQWGIIFTLNVGLIALLLFRRNYRVFPFFFLYVLLDFLHGVASLASYRIWGFTSVEAMRVAWGSQGFVVLARALAVAEICHRILGKYLGVWRLAWRVLLAAMILVSLYAWRDSRGKWQLEVLNLDRGLELAMATVIVLLFLFAVYYEVGVEPTVRMLTIGFFLFSCFRVLNDTILERWLHRYAAVWNYLGTVAFVATLLLWTWALRLTQQRTTSEVALLPENRYRSLSPEINTRLRALNERLGDFWHAEGKKT
jgi:hypothetical protein